MIFWNVNLIQNHFFSSFGAPFVLFHLIITSDNVWHELGMFEVEITFYIIFGR